MNKLNWAARYEHEKINNYKVLQGAFERCNIDKYIDVPALVQINSFKINFIKSFKHQYNIEYIIVAFF